MATKVKQLCRLCAEPCSEHAIQHSIEDPGVRCKLETVFNFKVPTEDLLPEVVCPECFSKVSEWYSYHETVRTNQSQLMSIATVETLQVEFEMGCIKVEEMDNENCQAEEVADTEADIIKDEEEEDRSSLSESSEEEPLRKRPKRVKRKYKKRATLDKPKPDGKKNEQLEQDNKKIREFFKITCEFCSESFDAFYRLQVHTRRAHSARASIKCCNRVMYKKCRIIEHIDSHLNPDRFHCDVCNKSYNSRYYLELHNLKKHSDEEKPFKCDKCNNRFPKEFLLKAHVLTHIQAECPVCHKMMASSLTLRSHMALMHGDKTKLICETCGEEFRTKLGMERHVKKHMGLNPIERVQCPICRKWVNGNPNLKAHIKTVHNEEDQRIPCDVCQQIYPNARAMTNHKRRVHIEEKFECEFCGKKFKRKIYLKEHRASHTGQSLYSCSVCGMTTNSNANLYSHKKSKHPEEWMEAKKKAIQLAYG